MSSFELMKHSNRIQHEMNASIGDFPMELASRLLTPHFHWINPMEEPSPRASCQMNASWSAILDVLPGMSVYRQSVVKNVNHWDRKPMLCLTRTVVMIRFGHKPGIMLKNILIY